MEKKILNSAYKVVLLNFFNKGGNVLDINKKSFDLLTAECVGVALCSEYGGISRGKALEAFVNEASDENSIKLFSELMKYYEESDYKDKTGPGYDEQKKEYPKCKAILDKLNGTNIADMEALKLKEVFNSDYINKQIDLMVKSQESNPTEAIGKAKELIESCCKTILERGGQFIDKDWDAPKLAKETFKFLKLLPNDVSEDKKLAISIKSLLGNLSTITQSVAEIRNSYGTGHGKSASYKGLDSMQARLVVGSTTVLVHFLWDVYNIYDNEGDLDINKLF